LPVISISCFGNFAARI